MWMWMWMWGRGVQIAVVFGLIVVGGAEQAAGQAPPPIPTDVPVVLVGSPVLDGTRLTPYSEVMFTIGGARKDGPLGLGEVVRAAAYQTMSLQPDVRDGREVWIRRSETRRVGEEEPTAIAVAVLDRRTLAPIEATVERAGQNPMSRLDEYDWDAHSVRTTINGESSDETFDLITLDAGMHETWMGAIEWREGLRLMIPTVLAGGGGKWWAVPHVVGREDVDVGDGVARKAWVVEVDWWGMGADHGTFTPGGGINGTAGSGGKYWVLENPAPGLPRVVRVRTEQNETVDGVTQIQSTDSTPSP